MERPLRTYFPAVVLCCAATVFACGAATGETKAGKPAVKGASSASSGVAAKVGDKTITLAELDDKAASNLMKVRQQEFEVRSQALDQMINDELLDREAKAKGVTKDKLVETEIASKAPDPSQAEVDAYYEANKARMGTQTKEQISPQIKAMLKQQKMAGVQADYMKSLRQKYGVKVMIEPPRVEVSVDDDSSRGGTASAPVTIVEFSDFQCPYCSRAETVVDDVMKKYGNKIRLVYRDYPLSFHPNAENAAMASECAKEQGKYWEMHKAMFDNQAKLAATDLVETAGTLGMDKDKFKTCLDTGKFRSEVQKDFQDGQKAGVSGTPTFFINGVMMVGARDIASFSDIIDRELDRSGK
ncbi:MAG TPA: thioredoxin domain-containing protein [Candidatus Polarisedimenticolia bacterium]|jgi:protein-disulfide isomerase|nr:thioredoxin domain-containing protein [Candidatus Polarisedimenticolia bacterium]